MLYNYYYYVVFFAPGPIGRCVSRFVSYETLPTPSILLSDRRDIYISVQLNEKSRNNHYNMVQCHCNK